MRLRQTFLDVFLNTFMVGEILVSFRHTIIYKSEKKKRETNNTFTEKAGHAWTSRVVQHKAPPAQ